jgi:hypothetical protein
MKRIALLVLLVCFGLHSYAQVKLSERDFNNLVALSELYTNNNMCRGDGFVKSADSLRTPVLDHMIDALIATGKADTSLLQKRFIARPADNELMLWYVLREIYYTREDTSRKNIPSTQGAQNVLAENIDERWLLDNYYYRFASGIAMLFNDADLSHYNFQIDSLGFKNESEKAIFFFNMMDELANKRFRVLQYLKKGDKLMALTHKMPLFNGKQYFYYTNLNIPDFDWIGYDKKESYLQRHIGDLVSTLIIQFQFTASSGDTLAARELYFNSVLYKPEYFKYSQIKDSLQAMYEKAKQ